MINTVANDLREQATWLESRSFAELHGITERAGADEIERLQAIVDKLPRGVDGDYLKCPLCGQYLYLNGLCPESCGNVGIWLANYHRAQIVFDNNDRLQAIVDTVPKCWQLVDGELKQTCPVVPGMTVWVPAEGEAVGYWRIFVKGVHASGHVETAIGGSPRFFDLGVCYNTREAAEASR